VCAFKSEAFFQTYLISIYNKITPIHAGKEVIFVSKSNHLYYTLDHSTYDCQYHLVWTPRYRGNILADKYIKDELKREFKQICNWKNFIMKGWHVGDDHIHLYLVIPPKYSIAYAIEILKGKTSTWIKKRTRKFPPGALWCRGYFVSTVGIDEYALRNYIANQEKYKVEMPTLF